MLLAQGSEPLPLSNGINVCANNEGDKVKEGHPGELGQELLSKSKADRRRNPGDFHHFHEAHTHGSANLMICASSGNEGHSHEVHRVLDWRDLQGN